MANPKPTPRLENLKPFRKGQSGNPGGRPKMSINLLNELDELLAEIDPVSRQSKAHKLMAALLDQGVSGSTKAIIHILDRYHGQVQDAKPRSDVLEERTEEERRASTADEYRVRVAVGLMDQFPSLSQAGALDLAEELDAAIATELASGDTLTMQLTRQLRGLPEPDLTMERKAEIVFELAQKHGLIDGPAPAALQEPEPPIPANPQRGPGPESDQAFLAARAVDDERERRERAKHPGQRPTPAGGPPPPPPPPWLPPPDPSCFVRMGDMCIFLPEE